MNQLTLTLAHENSDDYFGNLSAFLGTPLDGYWQDQFGDALRRWAVAAHPPRIKTLSLFSGAGGLDIAFHDAGYEVRALVEIEPRFVKTLEANSGPNKYLGHNYIFNVDIRNFESGGIGEVDFIIGGPPCQTFSAAGRRAAGVAGLKDSRGTLFGEYVRLLRELNPKGFLFENVYGITGAEQGSAWDQIISEFRKVGYQVSWRILDSADFGVPQHRERVFIVGQKTGQFLFPRPTHGPDSLTDRNFVDAKSVVGDVQISNSDSLRKVVGRYGRLLDEIPPGLNYSFFTEKFNHPRPVFAWRSKFSDFLYKAHPDYPVRTVKAQGGQYTGPFHWDSRPFTLDELKRLQTFPDAYRIVGGRGVVIHQIGNSVAPQQARILALAVLDQVFNFELLT